MVAIVEAITSIEWWHKCLSDARLQFKPKHLCARWCRKHFAQQDELLFPNCSSGRNPQRMENTTLREIIHVTSATCKRNLLISHLIISSTPNFLCLFYSSLSFSREPWAECKRGEIQLNTVPWEWKLHDESRDCSDRAWLGLIVETS